MGKPRTTCGWDSYGLRVAKKIAAEMRKEMSADPSMRRSKDPFVRGQRAALGEMVRRIDMQLAEIMGDVKNAE